MPYSYDLRSHALWEKKKQQQQLNKEWLQTNGKAMHIRTEIFCTLEMRKR